MAQHQRSLADLYVRGRDLSIDDGNGEIVVWLQKMNAVEHTAAMRKGNAARARVLALRFDKDSDEYQAILSGVLDSERDLLVALLAVEEQRRITPLREAERGDDEEWKDDSYLEGLREAWADGLAADFADDPEDAEAARVHDELTRFLDIVNRDIDHEIEGFKRSLETMSEQELVDTVMRSQIKQAGDTAWIEEYWRCEVAFGTRDRKNHRTKYFDSRAAVDDLQAAAYNALRAGFLELNVDPVEGKDLAGNPPSLDSSELSAKEETEQSSGQPAQAA